MRGSGLEVSVTEPGVEREGEGCRWKIALVGGALVGNWEGEGGVGMFKGLFGLA